MPRLEAMTEVQRQGVLNFPAIVNDTAPWTPPRRPLAQSTVALVTTAGLHLRGDRPFVTDTKSGDTSYRVIPADTPPAELLQSQTSIGFDRTPIYQDLNVSFPVDRLRELAAQGRIGGLARDFYSFMGALRNPKGIIEQTGPEVARRLLAEGVDVVLLTPT